MIDIAKTFAELRTGLQEALAEPPSSTLPASAQREREAIGKIGFAMIKIGESVLTDLRRIADAAENRGTGG